jgi:glycosyltransferase involved in cell wall biosynthesis
MKVCIIRNATVEKNAGLIRIIDALVDKHTIILITRSRDQLSNQKIQKKSFSYKGNNIENIQINLPTEMGKGIKNIINLFYYQMLLLVALFKNKQSFDVLHCFDLDSGLPVKLFSKFLGFKYIYHIADFYIDSRKGIPQKFKNIIKRLEFSVINCADTTIVCTEERLRQIKGSNPQKTLVVHNTPAFDGVKEDLTKNESSYLEICYIGTLSETRFIKQLVETTKNKTDIILKLGGLGPLENWVAEQSERHDNIEYLGKVDYRETFEFYKNCDLMVAIYDPNIPNHRYSAPNKVYEAMLMGKPIIVAKDTGLDGIVGENDIGYMINYSEKDFILLINELKQDKMKMNKKGELSKALYHKYSWEEMKKRVECIYKELFENR